MQMQMKPFGIRPAAYQTAVGMRKFNDGHPFDYTPQPIVARPPAGQ
jgi:hypothetical protein